MKELLDVCMTCKYASFVPGSSSLWCDKYVATINGLSIKDMANLGCVLCEREERMRKNAVKRTLKKFSRG